MLPLYGRAGHHLRAVVTEWESDFCGDGDHACWRCGRTKPRHARINELVERLQRHTCGRSAKPNYRSGEPVRGPSTAHAEHGAPHIQAMLEAGAVYPLRLGTVRAQT